MCVYKFRAVQCTNYEEIACRYNGEKGGEEKEKNKSADLVLNVSILYKFPYID